ncbi:hypothetical protein LCGC14_2614090, partial [marine sediment metagenome]
INTRSKFSFFCWRKGSGEHYELQIKMNKYNLIAIINVLEVILILGIITLAGIFRNWWLLLLLFVIGSAESEKRLLNQK